MEFPFLLEKYKYVRPYCLSGSEMMYISPNTMTLDAITINQRKICFHSSKKDNSGNYYILDLISNAHLVLIVVISYYCIKATDVKKMVTRFVVNYYILLINVNAVARQNVVITTFCNKATFWVATGLKGIHL